MRAALKRRAVFCGARSQKGLGRPSFSGQPRTRDRCRSQDNLRVPTLVTKLIWGEGRQSLWAAY
jgi:hypothetical protein